MARNFGTSSFWSGLALCQSKSFSYDLNTSKASEMSATLQAVICFLIFILNRYFLRKIVFHSRGGGASWQHKRCCERKRGQLVLFETFQTNQFESSHSSWFAEICIAKCSRTFSFFQMYEQCSFFFNGLSRLSLGQRFGCFCFSSRAICFVQGVRAHYRNHVKSGFVNHRHEDDPATLKLIFARANEDMEWIMKTKYQNQHQTPASSS